MDTEQVIKTTRLLIWNYPSPQEGSTIVFSYADCMQRVVSPHQDKMVPLVRFVPNWEQYIEEESLKISRIDQIVH